MKINNKLNWFYTFLRQKISPYLPLIIINLVIMSVFLIFGGNTYSVDSYCVSLNYSGHINAFLGAYRFFGAAVFSLLRLFAFDPVYNATSSIVFYIIIVSVSISWTSIRLHTDFPHHTVYTIDLALLVSVTSCWYCNILSFPECIVITGVGASLCFIAIGLIAGNGITRISRCITSGICLICATGVYQQFLALFGVYLFAVCCGKAWTQNVIKIKSFILLTIRPLLIWVSSGILYFIIAKVTVICLKVQSNPRIAFDSQSFLSNIWHVLRNSRRYIKGYYYFDTRIMTFCFLIAVTCWIVALMLKGVNKKIACFTIVLSLFSCLGSLSVVILSGDHGIRTMFPVWALYGFIALSLPRTEKNLSKRIISVVLIVIITANVYKSVQCELNLKRVNTADRIWTAQVLAEIEDYEDKNNISIENIEIGDDGHSDIISFTHSYSESATTVTWAREYIFNVYTTNRQFSIQGISEEKLAQLFEGKEWDYYDPDEQIIFVGNTVYICCY